MRAKDVAVIVIVGGVAAVLARWSAPAPTPTEREVVRTVVKPEIRYVDRTAPAPVRVEETVATTVEQRTSEQQTAIANVERLVASALTARRWTEQDRRSVHAQTPNIEAEQLLDVMRPLVVAANRQEVSVELVGSLY